MPGASPETMSTSVATPLERHLGAIAGVTEMTSRSNVDITQIVLQFDISRDIDGAARDVQAAINASRADLPAALRSNPTYRKFNPADFPILILALTSKTLSPGQIYDQASNIIQQKLSQISGVGDVSLNGASLPAIRIELNPARLVQIRHRAGRCARRGQRRQRQQPQGRHPAAGPDASRSMPTTMPPWPTNTRP